MDVSGGSMIIKESSAMKEGGSGGVGRYLGLGTGGREMSPRSGTQSVMGYAVWGGRVLRVQGLRGLQADAGRAVAQQVISNV